MKLLSSLFSLWISTQAIAGTPVPGGTLYLHFPVDPTTLNPITSTDGYASDVQGYVFQSLLSRDDDTYKWIPNLAEKWEVPKDGKSITYKLRPGLKWQDGKPLTADDVKYSFDVYFEGRFQAPHKQIFLQNFQEVKVIDPLTVKFIIKEKYYLNFNVSADIAIIPKHIYSVGDPSDPKFNKTLVGSGPYILEEWSKGQKLILKKDPNFWGNSDPYYKQRYFPERIYIRPVKEEAIRMELLKKGDLDFLPLQPEQYATQTQGSEWGEKVFAVKTENSSTSNFDYGYIAWNQKNPLFKDREARIALSMLIDRDTMISKFRYGLSEKARGPFGNRSPSSDPSVKAIEFDTKKALNLLQGLGWKLGAKGLSKTIAGKETLFEFTLLTANPDFERYATVMKEDMKKVGITMNIKQLEWNSFLKIIDERKFDAVNLAWSVNALEQDPKQIFHSASIPSPGHNFMSYSNPKVDELIDKLRGSMDEKVRRKYYHELHRLIMADQPYSFLFNRKFTLYAVTSRVQRPKDTFKYSIGAETWWLKQ